MNFDRPIIPAVAASERPDPDTNAGWQQRVRVKPLEWVDFAYRGAKAIAWNQANYMIQKWRDERWELSASYPGYSTSLYGIDRFYQTLEAAKAAAQADYEARILAALASVNETPKIEHDGQNMLTDQPSPVTLAVTEVAAADVLAERARQVSAENWTPEHDDAHVNGELARAASAYAAASTFYHADPYAAVLSIWPWSRAWLKPTSPRRDLVKAGALILAEIERLDRAALKGGDA